MKLLSKHLTSNIKNRTYYIVLLLCVFSACNTLDVFEKSAAFTKHEWKTADKIAFDFSITDTSSMYNIYAVVRHDDAYHYNNLWLNIAIRSPNNTLENQQVELTLANSTKGWLGTGIDDVFDHRVRITNAPIKLKKGNYHFILQHTMREDPLTYVLSAGIRVEKVQP